MNRRSTAALFLFFCSFAAAHHAGAFQCNVCHSKNPAMVKMHREVQEKDIGCFDCHRVGEKLMGKAQPKDRTSLLARRSAEPVCAGCHGKNQAQGNGEAQGVRN